MGETNCFLCQEGEQLGGTSISCFLSPVSGRGTAGRNKHGLFSESCVRKGNSCWEQRQDSNTRPVWSHILHRAVVHSQLSQT